jgi:AraC-like DNA-binding protein
MKRESMRHWYQRPTELISGYIRTVLILEGFSQSDNDPLPVFTNGMPALFCKTAKDNSGNEEIIQLSLYGASVPDDCWTVNNNTTIIAYFFKPFALSTVFNIHAIKLKEQVFDLSNWNPHKANALKTQLNYADTITRKVEVLDNLIIYQLQKNSRECEIIQYATDHIMYDPCTEILSEMLEKLKLNERTFQRIFKKYVGITPNQYRRICQFQLSFFQLRSKDFNKLTDVAYDNSFADQSHFIRSFKEFTNLTPNDYLKSGLKNKNE